MPPSNDDIANVLTYGTPSGSAVVTNVDATIDTPFDIVDDWFGGMQATVWFRLPATGWVPGTSTLKVRVSSDIAGVDPTWGITDLGVLLFDVINDPPLSSSDYQELAFHFLDTDYVLNYSGAAPVGGWFYIGVGSQTEIGPPDPNHGTSRFRLSWLFNSVTGQIRVSDPPLWRILVTNLATRTITILDHRSRERTFLFTLGAPAYHTGLVPADDPEINIPSPNADSPAFVSNNTRLIYGLRRERGADPPYQCRFGGILMNIDDESGDFPTSRYTAYDPWQLLMSRPVRNPDTGALPPRIGLTFKSGTRGSDIALNLLGATEAVDGETYIDTSDTGLLDDTPTIDEDITFEQGLSVGEAWNQLIDTGTIEIKLLPLYDPINFPSKVCQLRIAPLVGQTRRSVVMAWDKPSRSLTSVSRLIDGTRLANTAQFYGGQGGIPVEQQTNSDSVSLYGSYWTQQYYSNANQYALIVLAAIAEVLIRRNGQRTLTFDPTPERSELALRDYELGDFINVWASRALREPIGVDYSQIDPDAAGMRRVIGIPIDLDDNGTEMVRGLITADSPSTETGMGGIAPPVIGGGGGGGGSPGGGGGASIPAALPDSSGANTYYIDPATGSDGNPGSIGSPWQTLTHAATVAGAGDIVLLRAGNYGTSGGENAQWVWDADGSVGDPITIANYPGEQAIIWRQFKITASYLILKGDPSGGGGFIIEKNLYTGPGEVGLFLDTGHHVDVDGLVFRNTHTSAIYTTIHGVQIRNCLMHDCGTRDNLDHGIYWATLADANNARNLVANCKFLRSPGFGIQTYNGGGVVDELIITDCLAVGNKSGFLVQVGASAPSSTNITIRNCIAYRNTQMGFRTSTGAATSGNTVDTCISFGNPVGNIGPSGYSNFNTIANVDTSDPVFVDPTTDDYALQAASPAIDVAIGAYSMTTDFTGATRDATPDIGPMEFF